MQSRQELLKSVTGKISDYRTSELSPPSIEHVDRWVKQFDDEVQLPILSEMDHVLAHTYFSRSDVARFLNGLFGTEKLVGTDPAGFWKKVNFLDIQGAGGSQKEILALFGAVLEKRCGLTIKGSGSDEPVFVYLDDAVFTGNRVRRDLESWITDKAPRKAKVHIIAVAIHNGGQYYADTRIAAAARAAGKSISVTWWRSIEVEDRKSSTSQSDVLRPTLIPDDADVQAYVQGMKYKPVLRTGTSVGSLKIFSSDSGRQLLEQEFLKAGARIRRMCPNLGDTQRPLGHMTLETLGFGSLIVTFRNCPNNAPLAFWVDDPWYPLFPRSTNSATSLKLLLQNLGDLTF